MNHLAIAQVIQFIFGVAIVSTLAKVLSFVIQSRIADKYGVFWCMTLVTTLFLNFAHNWFAYFTTGVAILIGLGQMALIASGVYYSLRLSEYANVRCRAIQDLALLQFKYQELLQRSSISDDYTATAKEI